LHHGPFGMMRLFHGGTSRVNDGAPLPLRQLRRAADHAAAYADEASQRPGSVMTGIGVDAETPNDLADYQHAQEQLISRSRSEPCGDT
jgi:hypothetical protein